MPARSHHRIEWIDLAKASCILLVVLYHVAMVFPVNPAWIVLNEFLRPLRMPLFFFASGMLAAPLLSRSWETGGRVRAALLFHVYAIWALLCAAILRSLPSQESAGMTDVLLAVATGRSEIWYLWALAVFLALAWATRRLPWWVPVGVVVLLSFAAFLPADPAHRSMIRCLPFFVIGVRLPEVARAAADATPRRLLGLGLLFLALNGLRTALPAGPTFPFDLAAVAFGLTAAQMAVSRWPGATTFGRWLAARTLPIYVLHFPLVGLAAAAAAAGAPTLFRNSAVEILLPLVLVPAAVAASLLVHHLLLRTGFGWLFSLPAAAARRLDSKESLPGEAAAHGSAAVTGAPCR